MKTCRFLMFLAATLTVLLPTATLASDGKSDVDLSAGAEKQVAASLDGSVEERAFASERNEGEDRLAAPEIEIIPSSMTFLGKHPNECAVSCVQCVSIGCFELCVLRCPARCDPSLACCGIPNCAI